MIDNEQKRPILGSNFHKACTNNKNRFAHPLKLILKLIYPKWQITSSIVISHHQTKIPYLMSFTSIINYKRELHQNNCTTNNRH
jgi:hypothetical protein